MKQMRLLLSFLFLLVTNHVFAQSAEEVQAFALYKEAKADMDALRFTDALKKLEKAYAIFPLPQILARTAECYEKMGELERALELYRKVETDDPKLRGRIEKAIADIVFELNKPIELSIVTNVPDVEVIVDNVERFKAPCTIKVTRGEHTFEFKKPGYATITEEKEVKGSAAQIYRINMKELSGHVVLLTDLPSFEGVIVRLDEVEMAVSPSPATPSKSEPLKVRPGTHSLLCVKENIPPFMTTFDVAPDVTVEVTCKLKPPEKKPIVPVWASATIMAAGAAAAGVGGALVGLYYKDKQEFEDHPDLYRGFSSNKHYIGYALIGVGGAAIVTSAVLFLVKQEPNPSGYLGPVSVSPTPGGAMLSTSIAF